MNVNLKIYNDEYKDDMLWCITNFFGFLIELSLGTTTNDIDADQAEQNLKEWTTKDNRLYVVIYEDDFAGFLRIGFRGGNVAWIEDVFVKEEFRNRGIATESIKQAEEIIKATPPYDAICFDVVPRNVAALKLYHKLGYQTLSLITVRKNLVSKESSGTQK